MRTGLNLFPTLVLFLSAVTACSDDSGGTDKEVVGATPTDGPSGTPSGDSTDGPGPAVTPPAMPPPAMTPPAMTPPAMTPPAMTPPAMTPGPDATDPGPDATDPGPVMTSPTNTSMGGSGPTGGAPAMGGMPSGGTPNGGSDTGGMPGVGGAPPAGDRQEGPCDIYNAAGTECVAAYSTVRALSIEYDGPLYQVRTGSNAMNTGSGGETHDIGMNEAGFADSAAQDALCADTICTISLLYDQSGHENHMPVAKAGLSNGGQFAAMDDFESIADAEQITVGGHDVYSLYMEARQGYRLTEEGDGVPLGQEPQGIYMLADGTHSGTACCWDFGNVSPDPTRYGVMNTLFFGVAFWGNGEGNGPWFMADYEAGVWAGGTNPGDPGWGSLDGDHPANPANPSLRVPHALGFLKTNQTDWSLRMADIDADSDVTTAYAGGLPKQMANEGAIVLGVGGDNSNNSWGTFYEGAVVAGFPSDDTEFAVMQNIQAVGY